MTLAVASVSQLQTHSATSSCRSMRLTIETAHLSAWPLFSRRDNQALVVGKSLAATGTLGP